MIERSSWSERHLAIWLTLSGVVCASAIVAVVMPLSWHAATHECLGLGTFPTAPIAEYLARAMSGMCTFYGLLLVFLARDVRKYRGLITFQALVLMLVSLSGTILLWNSGLPRWWIIGDFASVWLFGLVVFALQFLVPRTPNAKGITTT